MTEHYEEKRLNTADIAGTAERHSVDDQREREHHPPEPEQARAYPSNGPEATKQDQLPMALLGAEEADDFQVRWNEIQVGFVDEPRLAVSEADSLVAELMKRLAESFSEERSHLEGQWSQGSDVSTEDLRLALKRYRSFFNRFTLCLNYELRS
jgi:hypothetical protein